MNDPLYLLKDYHDIRSLNEIMDLSFDISNFIKFVFSFSLYWNLVDVEIVSFFYFFRLELVKRNDIRTYYTANENANHFL